MSLPSPNITMNRNRARPFYTGFRTPPLLALLVVSALRTERDMSLQTIRYRGWGLSVSTRQMPWLRCRSGTQRVRGSRRFYRILGFTVPTLAAWIAPALLEALACRIRLTYQAFLPNVVDFLIFFRGHIPACGVQALAVIPGDPF
jgi:hypothetical protein